MNTAELDFPTIQAPPIPAAPPAKLPAVVEPAPDKPLSIKATVLAQFKTAEVGIVALATKYTNVAYDCNTTKGMADAVAARRDLRENGRLFLIRTEKDVKADVNDLKRVMADEVARLVAIVEPVEDAIASQIKAEEDRKAAAKAERERIESERISAHQAGIAKIRAYLGRCQQLGMTADRISIGIGILEGVTFGPEWQEFTVRAADAQCETLEAMRALHAQAIEREAEALRLEVQRVEQDRQIAENARVAAELAEQRRVLDAQATELAAKVAESERVAENKRAKEREELVLAERKIESELLAADAVIPAPVLMQDEHRPLSMALASKPDAPMHAREAANVISQPVPVVAPATIEELAVSLAECRAALFDACELLDGWIQTKAGKKESGNLFCRVNELRDLGGLLRPTF